MNDGAVAPDGGHRLSVFYDIDKGTVEQMQAELQGRRRRTGAEVGAQ